MPVDTLELASKAAKRWFESNDRSRLRFYVVTADAVKGTGVRHKPDLVRITKEVRRKMRLFDAEPARENRLTRRRA
jgi:hypothetical protein